VKGESECRRGESKRGERDHGDGSKDLLLGIELLYQVGDALVFFVALDFPSRVLGLPHSCWDRGEQAVRIQHRTASSKQHRRVAANSKYVRPLPY
jgi:hypothetical protein